MRCGRNLRVGIYLAVYLTISLGGDVEVNPGPRTKANNTFSVCHWNLNGISAHKYSKVSLLRAYLTAHKFNIVYIWETYLDSNTAPDNDNLELSGYNLIRSDHPSNSKRGSVYIYYKNFLHLRVLDIQYLHECINIELKIGDKLFYIIALYRSPSQSQDKFEKISEKLELNLDSLVQNNPFLMAFIGDFHAKSKNWYKMTSAVSKGILMRMSHRSSVYNKLLRNQRMF